MADSTATSTSSPSPSPTFQLIWERFKMWDNTATKKMNSVRNWRSRVLFLTIFGAFFGALSSILSGTLRDMPVVDTEMLAQASAIISAVLIGWASLSGKEFISDKTNSESLAARAVAETLKSKLYLYIFRVDPFHENANEAAFQMLNELTEKNPVSDLTPIIKKDAGFYAEMPSETISINDYIKNRLDEQLKYYSSKICSFQTKIKHYKQYGLMSGAAGVILGTLGATELGQYTTVWIALSATISASITTFFSGNKFQEQMLHFRVTHEHLELLKIHWTQSASNSQEDCKKLVADAEKIIIRENEKWITDMQKKQEKPKEAKPAEPETKK